LARDSNELHTYVFGMLPGSTIVHNCGLQSTLEPSVNINKHSTYVREQQGPK